ncbi:MAG: tRNA (guanosine(37)-N1)-methyltransferase TrmD [Candidatus Omnitrophica bacterium]|nr:tRNA (guanosine(37)-N1)-methyltransferase TrmD [Candidatus Omnitrophota bacterium]
MRLDVVTIFPEMFAPVLGASILKRAQANGRLRVATHDLRDYARGKRRTVDDRPYGGGPGMILMVEPLVKAVEAVKRSCAHSAGSAQAGRCQTVLMSPQGEALSSALAQRLATTEHLILICGHYEGVDERVRAALVDQCISIGDYVLTGGELPAMVLIDAVARFIPGVIGHAQATEEESFSSGWLEYPQYTRPPLYRGMAVPAVLRSGDHERIAQWRKLQSVARTVVARPDLVAKRPFDLAPDHGRGPSLRGRPKRNPGHAQGAPHANGRRAP